MGMCMFAYEQNHVWKDGRPHIKLFHGSFKSEKSKGGLFTFCSLLLSFNFS